MKYYFALDHYNYARWVSIHLVDCKALKFTAPNVFTSFMDGCFMFQKMNTEFLRIPLDQVHKQNNANIKGVAGATHLVNRTDEAGLIRLELCSNELAMMIQEFENELYDGDDDDEEHFNATRKHHKDTLSFQKCFFEDAAKLCSNFTYSPFELSEITRIDDTSVRFDPRIIADTKLLESNGEQQFNMFWNDRLIYSKAPVSDTIKKNNFCLMGNAAITSLPKDPMLIQAMVTKLRATYVARQKHAEISFQSEMFGIVQIISTDSRSLYHGSKSDILKGFKNETQPKMHENNSALIVDLSVIVKKIGQQTFRTFKELATNMYKHIMSLGVEFKLKESTLSQTDILKIA